MEASKRHIYSTFGRWATTSHIYAPWIILVALLAAMSCSVYIAKNLGMNTDTADMLAEHLPFRVNLKHYNKTFPQENDSMLVVLDAPTPEQAYATAGLLSDLLKNDTQNFQDIYAPNIDSFFIHNSLLYENIPELERIIDHMAKAQPLIAHIAKDPTLQTFSSVLSGATDELRKGRDLELGPLFYSLSTTLNARLSGTPRVLSWQELFRGKSQQERYQEFIMVKPKQDFTQLYPAEKAITALQAAAHEIGLTADSPIQMRITGAIALADEELNSSLRGMEYAGIITFIMVALVLFFAMRTIRLLLAVIICLILGLIFTTAFATAAIGHLNIISIAFAILYIGLGADFAIHFLLRYQEIIEKGLSNKDAIFESGRVAGGALTVCALTNAIAFYAFIPTDFKGVAELGVISGTGMLISLLVTLTIGPALLRYTPKQSKLESNIDRSLSKILEISFRWKKLSYTAIFIGLLSAVILFPQLKFDYNLLNMLDPKGEAVSTFKELLSEVDNSPWYVAVLAKNRKDTDILVRDLAKLPEVKRVVTILDFVPEDQEIKLPFIEEMALTTGPLTMSYPSQVSNQEVMLKQQKELTKLSNTLDKFIAERPEHALIIPARTLKSSLSAVFDHLKKNEKINKEKLLHLVEEDLLITLPTSLHRMQTAIETSTTFNKNDLPMPLINRWLSQAGEYKIAVYPSEDINDNDALRRFVRAIQKIAPQATGAPMINLEAGEAVVQAFIQAFSLALAGIVIALLILLRSIKYTILVLIPLFLSSIFIGIFTILLNVPFNFANIIALPLLLGIGLDSSLHMVHRNRNEKLAGGTLIHTSTARAVFYSALTSLVTFASLMFSSHLGTASMGILLTVGLACTLICTLFILPILLNTSSKKVVS
ncbi:MAG: hopanoid biosynthesis-associated RND transporter HpnN [Nitrosomonadaceae bacterium]|nr:hopanoid biosynthesis-associated RND transporter HpnN [Nitrosomonadaceae bacterium]